MDSVRGDILRGMRFLGYEEDCLNFVRLGIVEGKYVYDRLPNRDDFNGISESILRLYIRDLNKVLVDVNEGLDSVIGMGDMG